MSAKTRGVPSTRPIHPCLLSVFDGNFGAEYAVWAHITTTRKKQLPNLVTAQANTLRIFVVNEKTGKLELYYSFPNLSGSICYLESLPSVDNDADSLLIGFAGHPRLAVCSVQPAPPLTASSKILLTSSLIDLTQACMDASLGSVTPLEQDLIATVLKRRDEATLAVVLGGGVAVAAITLERNESGWRASTSDDPYMLNLSNLAPPDKQSTPSSINSNISAYTQKIAHRFGDIISCCFLPGYNEPTLVLLHAPNRTWSGRLIGGSQSCHVTAISVTVTHQCAAVLWSVNVSVDALSIQSTGVDGCLVVSTNSIIHVTNSGRISSALALNGWAGVTCSADINPNPWPLPRLAITLDGAKVSMIDKDLGFVILRYGQVYFLQRVEKVWSLLPAGETIGGLGQVASFLVLPLTDDKLNIIKAKNPKNLSIGILFTGSRLGDSSLLGYTLESDVVFQDMVKLSGPKEESSKTRSSVIKSEQSVSGRPLYQEENNYDTMLQEEEEALYAVCDKGMTTADEKIKSPDIVPPSDEEDGGSKSEIVMKQHISNKRAKLLRVSILRSISALDSITALGPLGPGCEGPIAGSNGHSAFIAGQQLSSGTAKILPCGHGSSGGLALLTAPGRDNRSILVEEDCLNVQSMFCVSGLILLGMHPNNNEEAGVNILELATKSKESKRTLSQLDIKELIKDEEFNANEYFKKGTLLAASELASSESICVLLRTTTVDNAYTLMILQRYEKGLKTKSQLLLSTGFPSDLLQVSPFIHSESFTVFGSIWSLGCAVVYKLQSDGEIEEFVIEGRASLVEAEDDDEEMFYQCNRITAIDIFQAPVDLFEQPKLSPQSLRRAEGKSSCEVVDEEDRALYDNEAGNNQALPDNDNIGISTDELLSEQDAVVYVAIARQNGTLQLFKMPNLQDSVFQADGCGQGAVIISQQQQKTTRLPRMHKVYSQEIRFFTAGPSNGPKDFFLSVLTNFGDVHVYKVESGQLSRISLNLPTRPSKKQSEHHSKLRRKKNLPSNAVDESIINPKAFYHNRFTRFLDISGQNGLFAATTRPLWLVTERRRLVALSHRSRHVAPAGGKVRPVCGFCAGVNISQEGSLSGFCTLHERIGRVGSQRLTVFEGISNFFSALGVMPGGGYFVEKIPMGVTVHRVQFIDDPNVSTIDHPLYVLLISREVEIDQSSLNDDGLSAEERQRIKDEKEEAKIKRQVEADLGGFDIEQEWVEEIERENCFEIDTSLGGAPPIRKSAFSLWLVDASNNWNVVDSYELREFEHGLTMKVVSLTEINVEPGSTSGIGEDVGTDCLFVTVGTGIVDADGEDVSAKGRVLLFEVKREDAESIAAGAQIAELSLIHEKEILHGPVTTLSCLNTEGRSRLVIGAGADVNVEQWGMKKLTQVGFFRATMQILDIMHFKNFFILSDAYDSLYFLVWRESDKSVTLLAKDYEPIPVYAAGLMSRGAAMTFVCHDDRQNLQFFQYAPGDAAARGGNKLVSRADIHLGAQTVSLESYFCRSSILINSATPSSTLAALKSQDSLYGRSDDDQRLGVNFGTSDGGFSTVIPLNESDYWRLAALQSVLANALESNCALNPRAWRLFRRTPRRGGCRNNDRRKGVIDGDLVIQYCDLPTADQEDFASAIGSTVDLIIDNLLELRCSSMVI